MSNDQYGGGWNNQGNGGQPQGGWDPYQQQGAQPPGSANAPGSANPPTQHDPYGPNAGQGSHGQGQFGQGQFGQGQFGQGQSSQGQYGQGQFGQGQYGQDQPSQGQYGQGQYGQDQYGQGQYGQGQYGQSSAQAQPGYGQATPGYGQAGQGAQQQGFGEPKKKSPLPWVAAAVGVALIAAIGIYAVNKRDDKTTTNPPSTSTSQSAGQSNPPSTTPPSTEPQSTAPSTTPATDPVDDSAKAPGPGTLATVMAELEKRKFTCSDEEGQPFTSRVCTNFGQTPTMFAYVGANADGSLGRLSLSVQSDRSPAESRALSNFFVSQFADAGDVSAIKTTMDKSADEYTEGTAEGMEYRGRADGSVVMYAPDFGGDGDETRIEIDDAALQAALKTKGYACKSESRSVTTCEKKSGAITAKVRYAEDNGIAFINVGTSGKPKSPVAQALTAEIANVFGQLPGGWSSKVAKAVSDADPRFGSMTYVDGFLFDYYPVAQASSGDTFNGTFYIRSSCWQDINTHC